jgi:hypothetical protein
MSPDTPVAGRAQVAKLFGVSPATLKRWANDAELEERFRLRDFTFRLGVRVATTPRLAGQFVDYVRSIDPRETVRHLVVTAHKELKKKGAV